VLVHVAFGALQTHASPVYLIALGLGFVTVVGLHLVAAAREKAVDDATPKSAPEGDGFLPVCRVEDVSESCGKLVNLGPERAAIFRHNGRYFASSNVCRHQGGPLGEGRIVDGCITCPWHGWNYRVQDGISPPPFHEVVPTYRVRIEGGMVCVHPTKNAEGTVSEGASA
jgi:sulfoxide reductase heme-binding subunit YedZ